MIGKADEIPLGPRGSDQSRYPFKRQWCVYIPSCSRHLNLTFSRLAGGVIVGKAPCFIGFH